MELPRGHIPIEWAERWRREKERRRKVIQEGEGFEQDDHELKRIVAYNDISIGILKERGEWSSNTTESGDRVVMYCRPGHASEVYQVLKELRERSLLTDLTLITERGMSFNVHSPVLAAVSSLIQNRLKDRDGEIFTRGRVPDTVRTWSLCLGPELDHVGMNGVQEFAYTGAIAGLNRDTIAQIRAAAQALEVPRVLDLCAQEEERMNKRVYEEEKSKMSAEEQMRTSIQAIRQLWTERIGCDVVLDVDGALFHVHRVLLAASSDYFRGMFTCGMKESHQPRVALPLPLASELQHLVEFCYSGALYLSWGFVFEVTCASLQLQFQHALSLCLDFLKHEMDAGSCLDVVSFAEAYGMAELLEEAHDFVLRHFLEVSATAKYLDLSPGRLLQYLRSDGLSVPTELAVFRAVVSWVQADSERRLILAGSLMAGVRFPLMTFREFQEVRAVSLRMESSSDKEVELYSLALKEFGSGIPQTGEGCRVRQPRDALVLVGGDRLNPDVGQRLPSRELWFANALRSGTGLVKQVEWRSLGQMPEPPRFRHGIGVMEGKLYVVGGCYYYTQHDTMKSAFRYDPVLDHWDRLGDLQELRSNFPVVVSGGRLLVLGGDREINSNVGSVEVYDGESDSWSFVRPLDRDLSGQAATVSHGEIFISGGFNYKYECLASMFLYHPERGTQSLADMTHNRAQHCMEALLGRLYVAGGICNLRSFYADQTACETYNPATDSWSSLAPLPLGHVGAASAVLEDNIYILGGYCQEDQSESGLVHRYSLSTGRWDNVGKMPGAVTDIRACLLNLPQHLRQ